MPDLNLTIDLTQTQKTLAQIQRQVPFACQLAINDLAFQVQRTENAAMAQVFKNPRPFTAKSVQVDQSNKASLTAVIRVRDEVAKYLQPYETGGVHVLPGKALLNPVGAYLDQYGQLPNRAMTRYQGRPDIFIGTVHTGKGPINGVWQRLQVTRKGTARKGKSQRGTLYHSTLGRLKLLIRFGNALPVRQHLHFVDRGIALIIAAAPAAFQAAFIRALR